jgi:subtilisin family serine protease
MPLRVLLLVTSLSLVSSNVYPQETATISRSGLTNNFETTAVVSSISSQPPPRAQSPPIISGDKLTNPAQLVSGFATNQLVKIIVNLNPPTTAAKTDFGSRSSLVALHSEIKQLQASVLASIPATEIKVSHRFENIPGFSARVTPTALAALQADFRVLSIEPDLTFHAHLAQGIPLIHGMTYRSTYNGDSVAIAICDTGVDYTHARLGGGGFPNSKVLGGYNFGDNNADPFPNTQAHGTCCAGIAAGDLGTVGDYIGGVAYSAKLYALKITPGSSGSADNSAIISAWDWCVSHKDDNSKYPILVISTSFGGGQYWAACDSASPSMTAAANNAVAAGITLLASAGNDGYCDSIASPACISSIISVGAVYDAAFGDFYPCVDSDSCVPKISTTGCPTGFYCDDPTAPDKVAAFANMAFHLSLLAPGNQCYTLDISGPSGYSTGDYYDSFGGTSAASAYAAGAAAVLQSAAKVLRGSYLTPAEVRTHLINFGDNITDSKVAITKPRINLERAIQGLTNPVLNFAWAKLKGGNGNQSVDPDECNDLWLAVRNDGYGGASNILATLSTTTPGVTILQPSSAYPDLAQGKTGTNAVAFRLSTSPAFICGSTVNLKLVTTYAGRADTNNFILPSGSTNYWFTQSSSANIVPGTDDTGNHTDDDTTVIALPFPYTFYGQTFTNVTLDSNGKLHFGAASSEYINTCLPVDGYSNTVFAFWDDLSTEDNGNGEGIYTSVSGIAPNRIFNIEWRAVCLSTSTNPPPTVNFEVRLWEGLTRIDMVYGALNDTGTNATVGIQLDSTYFILFECNAGGLTNGLQLTYQQGCSDGGGACAIPVISSPSLSGTALTFSFDAISGRTYLVQYKASLDDTNWQVLQTIPGDGSVKTVTNSTTSAAQRYFRLSVE